MNDTTFTVENLHPSTEYFFRVYVMNEFGRLGGSNIVNAKTGVSEIIKNGSFEVLNPNTGDPEYWNVWNNHTSFNVDSTLAHSGKNSMRLDVTEQTPVHSPLYQLIDPVFFVGGERYRITYTRYADDLTFSGGPDFADMLTRQRFLPIMGRIIAEEGMRINGSKTRFMRRAGRHTCTAPFFGSSRKCVVMSDRGDCLTHRRPDPRLALRRPAPGSWRAP